MRKIRPLFSEHEKKGLVQIKISENPRIWIAKSRWIYEQNHPDYTFKNGDKFIFLDGNNRNFSPDNVEVINNKLMILFCASGGVVQGHPEETKINLLNAKLKKAQLDAGEKAGLVITVGGCRYFRDEYRKKCSERKRKARRENPEKFRESDRKRLKNMTPEQKERKRRYGREYYWRMKKLKEESMNS